MELPGTRGLGELRARAEDLTTWKMALQKGCVQAFGPQLGVPWTCWGCSSSNSNRIQVLYLGVMISLTF